MTEEERAMLRELYRAFMEPHPVSGVKLIEVVHEMTLIYQRSGWMAKLVYRFVIYGATFAGALTALWHFRGGLGDGS